MLHKLACLMMCAGGLAVLSVSVQAAQSGPVMAANGMNSGPVSRLPPVKEGRAGWDSVPYALGLSPVHADIGLSDSERMQLREQIRAAGRDLYPDIYQNSAGSALSTELLASPPSGAARP